MANGEKLEAVTDFRASLVAQIIKNLLRKVKEESGKAGLKFNIQKMRSWHPIPSLQGE